MTPPKILCVIPALPNEVTLETLRSVWSQTVSVTQTLILTEKIGNGSSFPAKISSVLNNGLKSVNLYWYDYILRVDADVVLPHNFIEANLKGNPDVVGYGMAMLIKTSTFIELMDGKFFDEQDDSYITFKFAKHHKKHQPYAVAPKLCRNCGDAQKTQYFVDRGEIFYRFGYEPLHVVSKMLLNPRNCLLLVGYVKAFLCRKKLFDVADYVRRVQVQHFLYPRRWLKSYF